MNKHICIDCQSNSRRRHSPLCQKCFDRKLLEDYKEIDITSDANKYF